LADEQVVSVMGLACGGRNKPEGLRPRTSSPRLETPLSGQKP